MLIFKRSPSLVEQVKAHLKQRIINAEFETGRMPSEAALANELGVSRNTVRDALSRLEIEGMVSRKQGVGTFVHETVFLVKTRLEEILPYDMMIQEHGYTPTVRLISVDETLADQKMATHLNLALNENLLVVDKLFLADDKPVIFTRTYIPPRLITQPYQPDDLQVPIYQFVPQFCQQEFAYYLSEIVPTIASPWLADRLDLPQGKTALLSFEEVGYNQDDQPIVKAYSYFRDDLLRLRLIRRQTQ